MGIIQVQDYKISVEIYEDISRRLHCPFNIVTDHLSAVTTVLLKLNSPSYFFIIIDHHSWFKTKNYNYLDSYRLVLF